MAKKAKKEYEIEYVNRKAAHEFKFASLLEVGMLLKGTEIKSIRKGDVNLRDAYCIIKEGELFLHSLYIGEYKYGNLYNHEPRRTRKLLIKKGELKKWNKRVKEKGMTIVPYRLYVGERGFAKLEIALASGKKTYDKRETMKERDNKRELDRMKRIKL